MTGVDFNTIVGVAIGYLVAQLIRYLARTRFWLHIGERAREALEDPGVPVDDPREATERALLEAQRAQVEQVARRLSPSTPPPVSDDESTQNRK